MAEVDDNKHEPTLCVIKTRLLCLHYLSNQESLYREVKGALVKLFRPFVSELSEKARVYAYGCADCPSYYDSDAMMLLVDKFAMGTLLVEAWTGLLTHPERLSVEREISDTAAGRLEWGVALTGHIIELGIEFALNTSVGGSKGLYNEVKHEYLPAPCFDFIDTGYLVHLKMIFLPQYDYVLIDEAQDMTKLDCMTSARMVKVDGSLCLFDDVSQSLYIWAGANPVCNNAYAS